MWKWITGFFLVCVLVCGGAGALVSRSEATRQWIKTELFGRKPTKVRVEAVGRGTITRTINAPGSIEPKTKVQISAQVVARIVDLPFREGQRVKKDDVVVVLDSRDVAAALESAQASLRAEESRYDGLKAAAAQAERDVLRQRELHKTGDTEKATLEAAESALERASASREASKHTIEVARAQIIRAKKDLDNTTILAPVAGTITKLYAEVGELVVVGTLNNASSVIMEIADLNTMLMKARVDEANIAPVAQDLKCTIYINAYPNRGFDGEVQTVGLKRQIDRDGTGYFEVEVLVKKPAEMVFASGLTANVDIQVQSVSNVLKVPSQAVVDRRLDELPAEQGRSEWVDRSKPFARVVYAVRDGKAFSIPVSTGISDLTHTVMVGGLKEGDKIVTGPFKALVNLRDGQEVDAEDIDAPKIGATPAVAKPAGAPSAEKVSSP